MPERIDWRRELARAGSHTQDTLVALALRAGWFEVTARGKGSHRYFKNNSDARPVTIPSHPAVNTARAIIRQLGGGHD